MSHIEIAKQSARGTLLLFIGNVLSTAIAAAGAIVIARLLGPGPYGIYTLALVVPSIFYSFAGIGVNLAVTRYAAYHISKGEPDKARSTTRNAIAFLILMGAILTVVVYFGGDFMANLLLHRSGLGPYVQLASLVILGQTLLQGCASAFIGWNSSGLASVSSVLQASFKLIIASALILAGFGVYGALSGHVVSFLGAGMFALVLLYVTKLRGRARDPAGFIGEIREMVKYGAPPYVGGVVSGLAGQYVTVILAIISANEVVGYYQAALNVTAAITVVSVAISSSLFASFSSLEGVKADTSLAFNYAVKYVSFVSVPIVMFLIAGAGVLVQVLYGFNYVAGIPYLQLLALSSLPIGIGYAVTPNFFNGIGRTKLTMIFLVSGALVLAILAPLLGSTFALGVPGLIYAQIISNSSSALIGLYLASRYLKAKMDLRSSSLILLASLAALAATRLIPVAAVPGLVALGAYLLVFVAVYLTAVPLFRGLGHDDIDRLMIATEGLGALHRIVYPVLAYERRILLKTGSKYPTRQEP
ncbi:MAG: oligosaccharide flippase family protein [Nitrososphaerales archaeon]|nr:oligosaccharide flippase family protein [Nitrososphaerales archaeon]